MAVNLTQQQINDIANLLAQGPNTDGNYSDVYALVIDILQTQGAPADITNWYLGAQQVNASQGAYSALIRTYTER